MSRSHLKVVPPPSSRAEAKTEREPDRVFAPAVVRALEEALERARAGELAGVSIISYAPDWNWRMTSAGSVLSVPAIGIAAAHMLGTQFEQRLRYGKPVTG